MQVLARALPDDTRVAALLEELKAKEEPQPKPEKPLSESVKLLQASRAITKLQNKLAKQQRALEDKQAQRAQLDQDIAQLEASSTALAEKIQEARNKAAQSLAPSPQKAVAQCSREAFVLEKVEKFTHDLDSEEGGGLRISCDDILAGISRKSQSIQIKRERLCRNSTVQAFQLYGDDSERDDEQCEIGGSEVGCGDSNVADTLILRVAAAHAPDPLVVGGRVGRYPPCRRGL